MGISRPHPARGHRWRWTTSAANSTSGCRCAPRPSRHADLAAALRHRRQHRRSRGQRQAHGQHAVHRCHTASTTGTANGLIATSADSQAICASNTSTSRRSSPINNKGGIGAHGHSDLRRPGRGRLRRIQRRHVHQRYVERRGEAVHHRPPARPGQPAAQPHQRRVRRAGRAVQRQRHPRQGRHRDRHAARLARRARHRLPLPAHLHRWPRERLHRRGGARQRVPHRRRHGRAQGVVAADRRPAGRLVARQRLRRRGGQAR